MWILMELSHPIQSIPILLDRLNILNLGSKFKKCLTVNLEILNESHWTVKNFTLITA